MTHEKNKCASDRFRAEAAQHPLQKDRPDGCRTHQARRGRIPIEDRKMKSFIVAAFLLVFFAAGCGQEQDFKADISMTEVVWEGSLETDPTMLLIFNETALCLHDYGFFRPGYPNVTVTNDVFFCGVSGVWTNGCTVFSENRIYLQRDFSCIESIIYARPCPSSTLRHEIIHWISLKGNSAHNAPYFTNCEI